MHVVSVYGPPDAKWALVEMTVEQAAELVGDEQLAAAAPARVIDAARRDLEALARRSPELAESALAASAVAMAFELEHPFNSATAKSMCARALREALRELRELAPAEEVKDGIDKIAEQAAKRRAAKPAAKRAVKRAPVKRPPAKSRARSAKAKDLPSP